MSIKQALSKMVSLMAADPKHEGRRLSIVHCNCLERPSTLHQGAGHEAVPLRGRSSSAIPAASAPSMPTTAASSWPIDFDQAIWQPPGGNFRAVVFCPCLCYHGKNSFGRCL